MLKNGNPSPLILKIYYDFYYDIILYGIQILNTYCSPKTNIMKVNEKNNTSPTSRRMAAIKKETERYLQFILPPGVKFDDIYMDASDVAQELHISKRVVRNIRIAGRISYTNPFGKIFYYRQEIAGIMEANKTSKKE